MSPMPRVSAEIEPARDSPAPPSVRWIALFAVPGAALVALAISAQTYLSMLGHGHSFRGIFAWQLCCWMLWALAAPASVRAGGALVAGGHRVPRVQLRLVALGVGLISLHIALTAQLTVWFRPYVPFVPTDYWEALTAQAWALLPMDVLTFVLLVLVGWALAVHSRAQWLEVRESRLETDLARAHLEALRLEIQPHFLFNVLNAISALIRRRSNERALDMLVRLSELMRATLDRTQEPLAPLDGEIEFTRQYVDLQQARFADRLDVQYDIDVACGHVLVPTFLFQPLVENAVRHGARGSTRPCRIELGARLAHPNVLHLWIRDDGVGLAPGFNLDRDAHTGLGNIRSRLMRLYGSSARLEVRPADGGGTRVDVHVPASPAAQVAEASA